MAASDFLSYFSMKNMPFTTSIGVTAKLVCHQNSPLNCQILSSKIFLSKRS